MLSSFDIMKAAKREGVAILAFNAPYLPMIEPVIRAVVDTDSFAFVESARLEWFKFQAKSAAAVKQEYERWANPSHLRLHLDHVPVIDEDGVRIDYLPVFQEALQLGFHSVMIDGSRLDLEGNIAATREVATVAHAVGAPCEAELGAVLGHEAGPLPPYDELFASGKGFTDVAEAQRFVRESGCDWLSVAAGNIHGAISAVTRDAKKVAARLDLEHIERLGKATGVPLVLHGGSGIQRDYVLGAMKRGIAKINVGTEIRQAYETGLRGKDSVVAAQDAVYERTSWLIRDYFEVAGIRARIAAPTGL